MARRPIENRWQSESWRPVGIAADSGEVRCIAEEKEESRWLHPGFVVELFRDEAEGYYLNLDSPEPMVFVKWEASAERAAPVAVTVSYHEAARWMDGGATVDGVPMPLDWLPWLFEFVAAHYQPEQAKKRVRPASFKGARRGDR